MADWKDWDDPLSSARSSKKRPHWEGSSKTGQKCPDLDDSQNKVKSSMAGQKRPLTADLKDWDDLQSMAESSKKRPYREESSQKSPDLNDSQSKVESSMAVQKRPLTADLKDWDDIHGYMHIKQYKLRNQFQEMGIDKKSNIFEGVSIYVNGWTEPSAEALKEMIYAHGGKYEYNVYSESFVTHTIASNLPNSKILKLGSSIVCKPDWIVDSIAANTLLPVDQYLLYKQQDGQKKLDFSKAARSGDKQESKLKAGRGDRGITDEGSMAERHLKPGRGNGGIIDEGSMAERHLTLNRSKGTGFVNEFFTHSRLHYLSVWSTELKEFTADMLGKITPRLAKLTSSTSLKSSKTRAVVHIDLDCFFVSVSLRSHPHLKGKPIAITHAKSSQQAREGEDTSGEDFTNDELSIPSDGALAPSDRCTHDPTNSTSVVASCSYEARNAGVSNGMPVGQALKKCPNLTLLSYDFKAYREVSQAFYEILLHYSSLIEAVSCDEAYLELTDYCRDVEHVFQVVQELRAEVKAKTGCTVSAGVAQNMLMARMCTRVAKPDGQFLLFSPEEVDGFLASQKVSDLPGVGYSTAGKLRDLGVEMCVELKSMSLSALRAQFGTKTGKILYNYARGVDSRELKTTTERKSVSVDINFGIRFRDISEAEVLLGSIAEELQKRAEHACVAGNQITLKMKIRKQDAPMEPWKFLGHGACDNVSRSMSLLQPSYMATECGSLAVKLLKQLNPVTADIRGMGLQLSKLVKLESGSGSVAKSSIFDSWNKGEVPRTEPIERPFTSKNSPAKSIRKSPAKALKRSPAKSPSKPPKTSAKSSSMSLKDFLVNKPVVVSKEIGADASSPSSTAELLGADDSFRIDLPPASQLDHSVLAYLPTSMCQKILQSYDCSTVEIMKKENPIFITAEVKGGSKAPVAEWKGGGAEMSTAEGGTDMSAAAVESVGVNSIEIEPRSREDGAESVGVKSTAEMRSREDDAVVFAERRGRGRGSVMPSTGEEMRDVDGIRYEWRGGGGGVAVMSAGSRPDGERLPAHSASHVGGQVIARRSPRDKRLLMEITVCDDRAFLDSWKKYVHKHFTSGCSQRDKDTQNAVEYLCTLSRTNLEMTELCLKKLRRFIVQQQCDLSPTFDMILRQVQAEVKEYYHGVLKIDPLSI